MRTVLLLVVHFLSTLAKLVGSGGARTVVADTLLIVINQSRQRAPNLTGLDRFLFGFWPLFMNPKRLFKSNVILKASTFLHFHKILVNRKYHRLFSSRKKAKPGPKGPPMELIRAIVELKQRNTGYSCPRIAQLISTVFGIEIDEIKTVPYVPMSHPFVERLIGTLRREYLDQVLFWNARDLEKKLDAFKDYYNGYRVHAALDGEPPLSLGGNDVLGKANINEYRWKSHCRDLFQTPMAA